VCYLKGANHVSVNGSFHRLSGGSLIFTYVVIQITQIGTDSTQM